MDENCGSRAPPEFAFSFCCRRLLDRVLSSRPWLCHENEGGVEVHKRPNLTSQPEQNERTAAVRAPSLVEMEQALSTARGTSYPHVRASVTYLYCTLCMPLFHDLGTSQGLAPSLHSLTLSHLLSPLSHSPSPQTMSTERPSEACRSVQPTLN